MHMSEESNVDTTGTPQATEGAQGRTFTQEELDRIVGERVRRERDKYADYEELKAKAEAGAETLSECEKLRERAESAEKKAGELEHDAQLSRWAAQAAAETGVPAAVLRGETLEELQAHAHLIVKSMPVYPSASNAAPQGSPAPTRESILAIKNERERLKAIADNADLF